MIELMLRFAGATGRTRRRPPKPSTSCAAGAPKAAVLDLGMPVKDGYHLLPPCAAS
jgi:hypothetical protein